MEFLLFVVGEPIPAANAGDAIDVGEDVAGLPFGVDDRAAAKLNMASAGKGARIEPGTEFGGKGDQALCAHGSHHPTYS